MEELIFLNVFQGAGVTFEVTSGVPDDLKQALEEQVRRRLLGGWRLYFHEERVKVELMMPNPLRSGVKRAVNMACDGSDIRVQVHMETLPKNNEIYRHQLMKPLLPLSVTL